MAEEVLNVKNLKTYFHTENGIVPSVDDVSIKINKGETVAIVGESGSGKSVTSLSIMRLIESPGRIEDGQILFKGKDIVPISMKEMRSLRGNEIAMIFQEPLTSLNPVFTIGNQMAESIMLHQKKNKKEARQISIEMLKKVGIPRAEKVIDSFPHSLSGGMRQRVMIAMALSCNPELLIADEPTTALDVTIQAQILKLMKGLITEFDTSILLITHDLGVVAEMADRVVVMYAGQVVEETDVFTLFREPRHPYTKGLMDSTPKIHELKDELTSIPGTVPSPLNYPTGCRFMDRCPYAMQKCAEAQPKLEEILTNHKVRCWLHEEKVVDLYETKSFAGS
ncbi:ABC transporter ATP-binding protein [Psychrobacillus sp. MER TA 171]|uniref:ABC transporter ATP-binding protein n=1 Tax=Psychrobacillus sp. MER TA 171 TaxID=2939577 RepID=UPI00203D1EC1|nr:ABC transporter ATP-binding protein [Psychrobacillus sp. MER TA 171]MCM3356583.1 ABC transporter ATP-binding protein [Psychrobacillus sp. MER TA 171]